MSKNDHSKKRKPSKSRIQNAERRGLNLQGKSVKLQDKIKKANEEIAGLANSNSRLKVTKEISLKKSIAKWTRLLDTNKKNLAKINDKLDDYKGIEW